MAHAFLLMLIVVVVGIGGVYYLVKSRADTISFTYLGTHPQASQQPTGFGKSIITLAGFNNKIYAGFGDYNANSGPIAITPFDVATNSFAPTPEFTQNTQIIGLYRTINGKLYSPSIDIRTSNFAVGDLTSGAMVWKEYSWRDNTQQVPFMIHVFDINTMTGTDIWMAGSSNQDGTVFRSTDGGATWTEMQRVVGTDTMYARFYGVLTLNGKAYVQPMKVEGSTIMTPEANSRMSSNGVWSKGPNLLPNGTSLWHAVEFAGKAVYKTWANVDAYTPLCLNVFDGTNVTTSCPTNGLTDYAIDGDTLYGISPYGVYSTKDLKTWYQQGADPYGGVSITVMNGKIYVGTTDSKLYSAPVNPNPPVAGSTDGGTGGGGTCHGKKCGGGGTGGGGGTCNGKKCRTADGATVQ
jgi:hypothetical protein